jgi:inner membrane protein
MMSKTHLAIGVGSALAVTLPVEPKLCCIATIGGLLGGIIPDNDILDNDYTGDALLGQVLGGGIIAGILFLDKILNFGICNELFSRSSINLIFGLILFIGLYIFGFFQEHRKFTHSFLAMILYSFAILCIYPPITKTFMIGYLSHIIIDLFNKKNVQIFFPLKFGICFGFCYANKLGNKILMYCGLVVSVFLLLYGFIF